MAQNNVVDSLQDILRDIKKTLDASCYYVAVHMVLALPDICAALETPSGQTSGKLYREWYRTHLAAKYPRLTAEDCYSLRCGLVHQGKFGHPEMQYSRVLFTLPNSQKVFIHNSVLLDALNLDAVMFCKDILAAVSIWADTKKDDPYVQANIPSLVRYHPNGLKPFIVGVPVIG